MILSGVVRHRRRSFLLVRDADQRRPPAGHRSPSPASSVGWGVAAEWPYILPTSLEVSDAGGPSGTLATLVVATVLLVVIVVPGFILLYALDQKSLLPDEGTD